MENCAIVKKWNYTAFLFYQGESNTMLAERYAAEMEAAAN